MKTSLYGLNFYIKGELYWIKGRFIELG